MLLLSLLSSQTLHPRFTGDNQEKNRGIYAQFAKLAAKHSCTPPQLALAWLLHQGDDVVPIPGTTEIFTGTRIFFCKCQKIISHLRLEYDAFSDYKD